MYVGYVHRLMTGFSLLLSFEIIKCTISLEEIIVFGQRYAQ